MTIRGAGISGGMAPAGAGMSQEEFTRALDEAQAKREAEDARAYEQACNEEPTAEELEAGQ